MVGLRFEWRDDEVLDPDTGFAIITVCAGEYIKRYLPERRKEFKNIWTGERFILEEDEHWMSGPYFQRGNHMFSVRDPELKIELSEKAEKHWRWLFLLGERPVYYDRLCMLMRDARTDDALFGAEHFWVCDAGVVVEVGGKLRFTDGVRKDLPLGEIGPDEYVGFLRVSETEYSLRVGYRRTGYRYYLLDAANWTCRKV